MQTKNIIWPNWTFRSRLSMYAVFYGHSSGRPAPLMLRLRPWWLWTFILYLFYDLFYNVPLSISLHGLIFLIETVRLLWAWLKGEHFLFVLNLDSV